MGKDRDFKSNFTINNTAKLNAKVIKKYDFYNPDLVLEDATQIIVLEHSSTGDRKVHIGELTQFIDFSNTCKIDKNFNFILFLDGDSETSPDVKTEVKRLKYYINIFNKKLDKVSFIGICEYDKSLIGMNLNTLKKQCTCVYGN